MCTSAGEMEEIHNGRIPFCATVCDNILKFSVDQWKKLYLYREFFEQLYQMDNC